MNSRRCLQLDDTFSIFRCRRTIECEPRTSSISCPTKRQYVRSPRIDSFRKDAAHATKRWPPPLRRRPDGHICATRNTSETVNAIGTMLPTMLESQTERNRTGPIRTPRMPAPTANRCCEPLWPPHRLPSIRSTSIRPNRMPPPRRICSNGMRYCRTHANATIGWRGDRRMRGSFSYRPDMDWRGVTSSRLPAARGCIISIFWVSAHVKRGGFVRHLNRTLFVHRQPASIRLCCRKPNGHRWRWRVSIFRDRVRPNWTKRCKVRYRFWSCASRSNDCCRPIVTNSKDCATSTTRNSAHRLCDVSGRVAQKRWAKTHRADICVWSMLSNWIIFETHSQQLPGAGPTFREFVQYVIDSQRRGEPIDEHWRAVYEFCTPCSINFTLIAKVETFRRDTEYIIRQAGLETLLFNKMPQKREKEISNRADDDTRSIVAKWVWKRFLRITWEPEAQLTRRLHRYFAQLDTDLLQSLLVIYEPDFELFGYNSTKYHDLVQHLERPVTGGSSTTVPAQLNLSNQLQLGQLTERAHKW